MNTCEIFKENQNLKTAYTEWVQKKMPQNLPTLAIPVHIPVFHCSSPGSFFTHPLKPESSLPSFPSLISSMFSGFYFFI
jgi:hypothetical protein